MITLKTIRQINGLTQHELGLLIGKTKYLIYDLEQCRTKGSVATWDALEKALGVDQKILRQVDCSTNSQD